MVYLHLTDATAHAARTSLPAWDSLPHATLSPGALADALADAHAHLFPLIDATSTSCRRHTESVADFADSVCRVDADVARQLSTLLDHAG